MDEQTYRAMRAAMRSRHLGRSSRGLSGRKKSHEHDQQHREAPMSWDKRRRIPKWIAGEKVSVSELLTAYCMQEPLFFGGKIYAAAVWEHKQFRSILASVASGYVKRAIPNPEWIEEQEILSARREARQQRAARLWAEVRKVPQNAGTQSEGEAA